MTDTEWRERIVEFIHVHEGLTNPGEVIIKVEPGMPETAPQVSPSTVSDCTRKAPLPVASHVPE